MFQQDKNKAATDNQPSTKFWVCLAWPSARWWKSTLFNILFGRVVEVTLKVWHPYGMASL